MGAKRLLPDPSLVPSPCPVVPLTDLTSGVFFERGKCWLLCGDLAANLP